MPGGVSSGEDPPFFSPSWGTAVGIVNVGGFTASLTTTLLVGLVLSVSGGYTPEAFRLAWLVQFPIWALTAVAVVLARRKARRVMAAEGTVVPPLREALRRNRRRRQTR